MEMFIRLYTPWEDNLTVKIVKNLRRLYLYFPNFSWTQLQQRGIWNLLHLENIQRRKDNRKSSPQWQGFQGKRVNKVASYTRVNRLNPKLESYHQLISFKPFICFPKTAGELLVYSFFFDPPIKKPLRSLSWSFLSANLSRGSIEAFDHLLFSPQSSMQ